jgi:hypothetical protein
LYQFQQTKIRDVENVRQVVTSSLNWPLGHSARLEAEAQYQYETISGIRNWNTQARVIWQVAAVDISAIARYNFTRSSISQDSGSYAGIRIGRSFQAAW